MKGAIIFAATSTIAQEILPHFFVEYDRFVLVARNDLKLDKLIKTHADKSHITLTPLLGDLNDISTHVEILTAAKKVLGEINLVVFAQGILPDLEKSKTDWSTFKYSFDVNFTSIVSLIYAALPILLNQKHAQIAVLSSVAGDRARKSNYPYGCSKSALTYFLEGLRLHHGQSKLKVTTLLLGMVDTAMTKHMKKGVLFSSASFVGKKTAEKILQKVDTAYIPTYWFWVMLIIKLIPEKIFKKLNF